MERRVVHTIEEATEFLKDFNGACYALDTETDSLDWVEQKVIGISICDGKKTAYFTDPAVFSAVIVPTKPMLMIMHNATFDIKALCKGYYPFYTTNPEVFDTMVADHLIDENRGHGLKDLARDILGKDVTRYDEASKHGTNTQEFYEYAMNDAEWTWELAQWQKEHLKEQGLDKLFREIEMPFIKVLARMEMSGIRVDLERVDTIKRELETLSTDLTTKMLNDLGEKYDLQGTFDGGIIIKSRYNFNSTHDLNHILFEKLGLKPVVTTKTGGNSTGSATISALRHEHPFVDTLYKYKIVRKLLSAFFEPLPDMVDDDGRVRPHYHDTGTVTGRLSASKPNCLDESTEALTRRGWVCGYDLRETDEVAVYDTDGSVRFEKPSDKIYTLDHDGLYSFSNEHLSIRATREHRHLLRHRKTKKSLVTNSPTFPSDYQIIHAGTLLSELKTPALIQRLAVAIQADAYLTPEFVDFKFTKKRKYDRLIEILSDSNITWRDYSNKVAYRVYIRMSDIPATIYSLLTPKKEWCFDLDQDLSPLVHELRYWDGLSTRDYGEWYCSIIPENVNMVQAAITLCGYRVLRSPDGVRLSVTGRDYSLTTNVEKKFLPGTHSVWCLTVSTGFFIVRRNGKPWVTGNCQQLPKVRKDLPIDTRSCFIATEGKTMIAIDYSQQELRIAAELCRDENFIRILANDGDLHLANANSVFNLGISPEALYSSNPEYEIVKKKYKRERDKGKVFSFGILYGMGPHKLSRDFNVSLEEAERMLANYFDGYPSLREAISRVHKEAEENLYVTTLAGRRRHFSKTDGRLDFKSLRQSFNFLIQSFGADIIRRACIRIQDYADKHPDLGITLLMTVHDEVVLEANTEWAGFVAEKCRSIMEGCAQLVVPLRAEASTGSSYGACK